MLRFIRFLGAEGFMDFLHHAFDRAQRRSVALPAPLGLARAPDCRFMDYGHSTSPSFKVGACIIWDEIWSSRRMPTAGGASIAIRRKE
jgi:hypothetical protein